MHGPGTAPRAAWHKEGAPPTSLSLDECEARDRRLLREGDLDQLCAIYFEPVLQWIRASRRVSHGEAQEIRQEVFLRFTREARAGRDYPLPIAAALYRITDWTIDGYVARAARRGETEQTFGEMPGDEPADDSALREFDGVGQDDHVEDLFARLPDRERTLMTMHYIDKQPLADIAGAMGIRANNAHQIHHRAKRRLAELIAEGGP